MTDRVPPDSDDEDPLGPARGLWLAVWVSFAFYVLLILGALGLARCS